MDVDNLDEVVEEGGRGGRKDQVEKEHYRGRTGRTVQDRGTQWRRRSRMAETLDELFHLLFT